VNFTNNTSIASGKVKTWEWSFGDGGTSAAQNPHYCYSKAGVYTVTLIAISDSGCKQQLFISNMITVYDHPHADFTYAPQPVTILQPFVQFTDQSVDQYGISKWFWSFGDASDSTSTLQNPGHTYADTGTFCQSLTVTNIHSCTDAVEKCLIVEPFFALYVPDAFTPNHDGLNDVFMVEGKYICDFEIWIFDRWGMQLYHSTDITKGWNGTVGGDSQKAQEDTYVYLIKARDCRDDQHQLHTVVGKVTLLK
ncbi:MAG TPA: PKD domain-containing protein, partial [Bacteroidia bacterium]|nr:PKD domain-containing protein [Bacteroidia bacterium]